LRTRVSTYTTGFEEELVFSTTHPAANKRATGARILDRAEGVLVGLRRCRIEEAFDEIVSVSHAQSVPAIRVARALVELAEGGEPADHDAGVIVRQQWGHLLAAP
jgi:AmiR/NasT family two-component response regulator